MSELPKNPNLPSDEELQSEPWKATNELMYYNTKEHYWFCVECKQIISHGPVSGREHAEKHGLKLATSRKPKTEKSVTAKYEEIVSPGKMSADQYARMRKEDYEKAVAYQQAMEKGEEGEAVPMDGGIIELDEQSKYKVTNLIVNHPELRFTFTLLRKGRELYPQWDYATWIFECVNYWLRKHGIVPICEIPREVAFRDPSIAKYLDDVAVEWKKYEAEALKVEK